jgi:hypothetical protein
MFRLWHQFSDIPYWGPVLSVLQLAFTIWMLADAYSRRVEYFWYWVIFIFQPIGPWVYLFVVKRPRFNFSSSRLRPSSTTRDLSPTGRRLSLDELRFQVNRAPTVFNRFALAELLMDRGAYTEAIPLLEAVLAIDPNYCSVLHALAVCRLATNAAEEAVPPLEKLLNRDPRWENYRAWHTLIEAQMARGQTAAALTACQELANRMPTLENNCLFAKHLLASGRPSEAVKVLHAGLEDYNFSPWKSRWRNWRWAKEARQLLTEADKLEKTKEIETKKG